MEIKEIKIKLPESKSSIDKFFNNCQDRKKFIHDTKEHYIQHLRKANHDLTRALAEFNDECWDWTIIKSYYSIHHAGNALLSKSKEVFSKDHSCLIIALKYHDLVDNKLFKSLTEINEKFSDVLSLDITFQLRKISQYNVDEWEKLTRQDAELILNVAKKFVKFVGENV